MLKTILLTMMYVIVFMIAANSQTHSDSIQVTFNKTSSIIFPANIGPVDRGSNDIIAQKPAGVSNILKVKAGRRHFPASTNLTVITTDGQLYHFIVTYSEQPDSLTFSPGKKRTTTPVRFESLMTADEFKKAASSMLSTPSGSSLKSITKNDMRMSLDDIRIRRNVLFFQVTLTNRSNISYDTELLRFFIRDNKRVKRTATQETPVDILFQKGDRKHIDGKSTTTVIFAVQKFTIPDSKHLVIQLMESNGGRHLQLKIKNKNIIRAGTIPE